MSDVAEVKTIGEVERIVHASGLWDGTGPVAFADDHDGPWYEAWAPTADPQHDGQFLIGHPSYARVDVYRKDVRIPTTVVIRWDEQFPAASEEWAEKWRRSPMRHFGRTARMVGFRQTFRDLLGDIVIEDEDRASASKPPAGVSATGVIATEAAPAVRDWAAEFDAATAVDVLDAIVKEARAARVFKPNAEGTALDRQWKARRAAIIDAEWNPPTTPELSPEERIRSDVFFPQSVDEERPVIRNRADRRAAARKKGRRR